MDRRVFTLLTGRLNKNLLFSAFLFCVVLPFFCCVIAEKQRSAGLPHEDEKLPLTSLTLDASKPRISASLSRALQEASPKKRFKVLLDFREQLDLVSFRHRLTGKGLKKSSRRVEIINALKKVSDAKEKEIRPVLESLLESGDVEYFRKFSIVNRCYVVGNAGAVRVLSQREDVARVIEEYSSASEQAGSQLEGAKEVTVLQGDLEDNWALRLIGAEQAWKMGWDGTGVVIGSLDTGIWLHHEQLKENFRGGADSWFDPVTGSREPFDSKGHGTGVLSCAAGTNPNKRVIGVARGSRWIAALANHKNYYNNIKMTYGADWMLNIGKPDVIVNAWSHGRVRCQDFDLDFIHAWKAAEIFPVFAAGNLGPLTGSSESPADLLTSVPEKRPVFSVGSVNAEKAVSRFSSRGPSRCSGEIFPIVVAPGEDVFFAFPVKADSYIAYSGTSAASGYAAGVVAILIQRYPEKSVEEIEDLMKKHSIDLGEAGPDHDYGFGLLHLPALLASD